MEEARSTVQVRSSLTAGAKLTTLTGVKLVGGFVGSGNGNQEKLALPIDQMTPHLEAIMYGRPITMENYLNAKVFFDPLRIFDCALEADGANAFIAISAFLPSACL